MYLKQSLSLTIVSSISSLSPSSFPLLFFIIYIKTFFFFSTSYFEVSFLVFKYSLSMYSHTSSNSSLTLLGTFWMSPAMTLVITELTPGMKDLISSISRMFPITECIKIMLFTYTSGVTYWLESLINFTLHLIISNSSLVWLCCLVSSSLCNTYKSFTIRKSLDSGIFSVRR